MSKRPKQASKVVKPVVPVEPVMKSPIVKRSIVIAGHKTSVSLEEPFWGALKRIRDEQQRTLSEIVADIDKERVKNKQGNLSSALRLHVLHWALGQADMLEVPAEMAHG